MAENEALRASKDIETQDMPGLAWDSARDAMETLSKVFTHAERKALAAIDWYYRKKKPDQFGSRLTRGLAILFAALGGLTPMASGLPLFSGSAFPDLGRWGYVLLGLAASSIATDRFFGFSHAWMRYIKAAMILQRGLSGFRFDWALMTSNLAGRDPQPADAQAMLLRAKEFVLWVDTQVEQETEAWIQQFRASLAELNRKIESRAEASKSNKVGLTMEIPPGAVQKTGLGLPITQEKPSSAGEVLVGAAIRMETTGNSRATMAGGS